ncbi:MAG: transcription antitermination factor NusB [Bacteroidales bacterium]|nr:transcription antitermination factor NusB [Lentimicrobiaceae bacterium]MDD5694000.1 transcription antitermination factor NusB [Bacteroidales bacterium]
MLSRRHIRIKVMQALYAYSLDSDPDIIKGENELMRSIQRLHELYIYQLSFLIEIFEFARYRLEEAKQKYLPTEEDLHPNTRFVDNMIIRQLTGNLDYCRSSDRLKISWKEQEELVRRLFQSIRTADLYKNYMTSPDNTYEDDREFVLDLFKQHIQGDEAMISFYEEKYMHWANDYNVAYYYIEKTIRALQENSDKSEPLPGMPPVAEEEDREFSVALFKQTIRHSDEYEHLIAEHTLNWDTERIAMLDMLLLKMAVTEIMEFPFIPVKVSFNEYIEISKEYSTPKSKVFINGILDKLINELTQDNRIKKSGRGLMDR